MHASHQYIKSDINFATEELLNKLNELNGAKDFYSFINSMRDFLGKFAALSEYIKNKRYKKNTPINYVYELRNFCVHHDTNVRNGYKTFSQTVNEQSLNRVGGNAIIIDHSSTIKAEEYNINGIVGKNFHIENGRYFGERNIALPMNYQVTKPFEFSYYNDRHCRVKPPKAYGDFYDILKDATNTLISEVNKAIDIKY